ncbi:hypothetical protein MPTK1_1g26500 [Marchantia polymorpha subsp. ruderalis]|uniref:Chaperonin-like RbcX protein n=2 Tax=Marchantia polymorpha TaxID=3197 RepID=A0AAF6AUJ0_MARPO|nr:hypothetical protein MARPO_0002s0228 [Marchantia polymorpha]BBN00111.1 hypothetical protein Mp_1g26500 [Marchantia polymorpha subsp. ruderalis]|eukprot:PTQ49773.1 hypothetical protein MARPO_0002s0228 [Marchantia polymorpha]
MTGGVLSTPMLLGRCSSSSRGSGSSSSASVSASVECSSGRCRRTRRSVRGGGGGGGGDGGVRGSLVLENPWACAWQDWRSGAKVLAQLVPRAAAGGGRQRRPFVVRDDLGGQYEDSFDDVDKHLLDYFTFKAVRTVLAQLAEMNPHQYAWFYNYVVNVKPQDSKVFLQRLVKEKQELAERVMVTRLHLFNKWVKKYNHAQLHKAISDENLALLRERLMQTVKFSNTENNDLTDDSDSP